MMLYLMLFIMFCYFFNKNDLITLFLTCFIFLPFVIFYLLHKIDKNEEIFKEKISFLLENGKKLNYLMIILFFVICLTNQYVKMEEYESLLEQFSYFYMAIMYFLSMIILNIQDSLFISKVQLFVNSIEKFIKDYFVTNIFLIIILFLFRNHSDIKVGLISSYIFFVLTRTNEMYLSDKEEMKNSFKKVSIYLIILIILSSLYFAYLENLYDHVIGKVFSLNFWYTVFAIMTLFHLIALYYVQKYPIKMNKIKQILKK